MQMDKNKLNFIEICGVLLCVAVIFAVSLSDDEDARVFTFLVAVNILICAVCVLFRAIRKRGYQALLKILIIANLLICFNMEIYRGIMLFWITVSSPIAEHIAFLYILSRFTFYPASRKFKDGKNNEA